MEQHSLLKHASLSGVLTKLTFWSDSRDRRIVEIIQPDQNIVQTYVIAEKDLSGEIDLCIARTDSAMTPVSKFIIVWRSFVDYQTNCEPRHDAPSPVCGVLSVQDVLFGNRVIQVEEEGQQYWLPPALPIPLVFKATEMRAEPNANVLWERE
ncbi:MAG TPA: hypothetical protein VG711_03055 [Phycisphaerales bacterium]|nr:hypothetical protein [Phycisphaerales bacterium]